MSTAIAKTEETAVQRQETDSLEALVIRGMNDSTFDVNKLERLVSMMERREEQARKDNFYEALARVQAQIKPVEQNGMMDRGPGKGQIPYALREDIRAVIRPIYLAEGFTVTWDAPVSDDSGNIHVEGAFTCCGHTEKRSWTCKADASGGKTGPQAVSSTVAYGKRQVEKMFWDVEEKGKDKNGAIDEPITEKQVMEITDLLADVGADVARFKKHFKVETIAELRASQLQQAYDLIETKRRSAAR